MLSKSKSKILFASLTLFGVLLIILGSAYLYYDSRILSFTGNPYKNIITTRDTKLYPDKLSINSIGIKLDVEEGIIIDGIWKVSSNKATHLVNSSVPAENGNIIIYGHNTWAILGRLSIIKKNDEIELHTKEDKTYLYKVTDITWVKPTDIDIVKPTTYPILTIYTCTGFLDQYRLVVKATPR